MTTTDTTLEHEKFCLPRPGEKEPRIESFRVTRYAEDGIHHVSEPTIVRCIECGTQELIEDAEPTPAVRRPSAYREHRAQSR